MRFCRISNNLVARKEKKIICDCCIPRSTIRNYAIRYCMSTFLKSHLASMNISIRLLFFLPLISHENGLVADAKNVKRLAHLFYLVSVLQLEGVFLHE